MVKSQEDNNHEYKAVDGLITLMAAPLLTGPATISFITLKAYEIGKMTVFINVLLAYILVGMVFIILAYMIDKINLNVVDIVSRVMGLFLSAVAIEMIAKGVEGIIHAAVLNKVI
jgi:multiple antibiotic resistance protein